MKIVIDIPEGAFESVKRYYEQNQECYALCAYVANGIPLPKHHGDLIDRRELKKEVYTTTEWNGDIHRIIYEASIDDAKPIIEGSEV